MEINVKDHYTVKEIKKLVLTSKKESKELSQAWGSILKQVEAQTVGVKNPETDENKLILKACKKELKELEQAKTAGAPYSGETLTLCTLLVNAMSPKLMSERETEVAVESLIGTMDNPNMGQVMGGMKAQYGEQLNMKILSSIVKNILSK
jgi:hypothetical protein